MSDNILIDVSTTIENVNVEVVEASAASIGIEYFYPQGPIGPTGPQGPAGSSLWGTISGTLSAQTDLWRYLSAVGTSNFDIVTLNNYLSTTPILLSSINVFGPILSAGVNLLDIFLTKNTTFNNYIYTTVSQNVSSNRKYGFDTTLGSLTATLPSNPQLGDEIEFFDIAGTWNTNNLIINNNTKLIEGYNDTLLCNVQYGLIKLIYTGSSTGWRIVPLPKHNVSLLVLAPIPVISAASFTGTTPFTITLSGINTLPAGTSPVTNWYWNLTGGNTAQFTTQNVTYTYTTSGSYTVNLTASNTAGFGTTTQTLNLSN
jgi:hypothetical protein